MWSETYRVEGGGAPSIALFYNKNDFEDVTSRIFRADRTKTMNINQGARDLVFSLTDAHLGAVASMLGAIYHVSVIHLNLSRYHGKLARGFWTVCCYY